MSPQSFVTEYGSMDSAVTCSSSWPSLTLSWSSLLVSHEPDISSSVTSQFRPYSHSWLAPSLWLPLHPSLLAYAWPHHSSPPLAGCHHCYCCLVTKPCLSLCDPPMDCNLPDSSVHGILQAKIMERVAISFFRGSSRPRDWTRVSCISRRILYHRTTRKAPPSQVPWVKINPSHR